MGGGEEDDAATEGKTPTPPLQDMGGRKEPAVVFTASEDVVAYMLLLVKGFLSASSGRNCADEAGML